MNVFILYQHSAKVKQNSFVFKVSWGLRQFRTKAACSLALSITGMKISPVCRKRRIFK